MTEKLFTNLIKDDLEPTHFVEPNYSQQYPEQMDIYLFIDLDYEPARVYVDTANFSLNGTPVDIWHHRRLCYKLPYNVDAGLLHDWIEDDLVEAINTLIKDTPIEWNGSDNVGVMGDDARALDEHWEIYGLDAPTFDGGGLYTPSDYFSDITSYPDDGNPKATIDAGPTVHTITSATTDKEIETIAQDLEEYVNGDNVVLNGTIEGFLVDLREDCETYES